MIRIIAIIALLAGSLAHADWTLVNDQSRVNFVTTKAGNFAEAHYFRELSGKVREGIAHVTIALVSVDTAIDIRNERMREFLFRTDLFPTAEVTTPVDVTGYEKLKPGEQMDTRAVLTVSLNGQTQNIPMELVVSRLADNRMLVASRKPAIVNASQFQLASGVEKLRELAGLPSISQSVPVTFLLTFARD